MALATLTKIRLNRLPGVATGIAPQKSAQRTRRLLLLVNESGYFLSHRVNVARAALEAGFDVHVVTRLTHDPSRA